MTESGDEAASAPSVGDERPRIVLKAIDQFVFGFTMLIAMLATAVGVVMVVDSRGRFPYVLIGGLILDVVALVFLNRRYRTTEAEFGLPATETDNGTNVSAYIDLDTDPDVDDVERTGPERTGPEWTGPERIELEWLEPGQTDLARSEADPSKTIDEGAQAGRPVDSGLADVPAGSGGPAGTETRRPDTRGDVADRETATLDE